MCTPPQPTNNEVLLFPQYMNGDGGDSGGGGKTRFLPSPGSKEAMHSLSFSSAVSEKVAKKDLNEIQSSRVS